MKAYMKIVLLVTLALLLALTACSRPASKPPVASPTVGGEVPFPVSTPGTPIAGSFATQTAIASIPGAAGATPTAQVIVATETSAPTGGGGQATPESGTGGTDQGGGQTNPSSSTSGSTSETTINTPVVTVPTTYTLQKGEWPICIARRYNLDIPSFFSMNGMNMNSKPGAGTLLKIPTTGSWNPVYGNRALVKHPATYTVAAGDSVYSIACRYGDVAPESILAVNNLGSANDIKAGMALRIP